MGKPTEIGISRHSLAQAKGTRLRTASKLPYKLLIEQAKIRGGLVDFESLLHSDVKDGVPNNLH